MSTGDVVSLGLAPAARSSPRSSSGGSSRLLGRSCYLAERPGREVTEGKRGFPGPGACGAGRSMHQFRRQQSISWPLTQSHLATGREMTEGTARGKSRVSLGRDLNPLGIFPLPGGPFRMPCRRLPVERLSELVQPLPVEPLAGISQSLPVGLPFGCPSSGFPPEIGAREPVSLAAPRRLAPQRPSVAGYR